MGRPASTGMIQAGTRVLGGRGRGGGGGAASMTGAGAAAAAAGAGAAADASAGAVEVGAAGASPPRPSAARRWRERSSRCSGTSVTAGDSMRWQAACDNSWPGMAAYPGPVDRRWPRLLEPSPAGLLFWPVGVLCEQIHELV